MGFLCFREGTVFQIAWPLFWRETCSNKEGIRAKLHGIFGITWSFLHRMSHTGESDGVKRGHSGLCRAVSSTHGESWRRWCLTLVSNQARVSVRRISLHLSRSIWRYLKPALDSTFCLKKSLFFSPVVYISFFLSIEVGARRPRCLSFIRRRRGHNEAVCPCPAQCSKMLYGRIRTGTFCSRAERYQLKVCNIRSTLHAYGKESTRSFFSWKRTMQKTLQIHGRDGKHAGASCVKPGLMIGWNSSFHLWQRVM